MSIHACTKARALQLSDSDARQVLKASTHWLRHSHAPRALNGDGHEPVALEVARNNMGHSPIETTSGYHTGERRAAARHGGLLGHEQNNRVAA